MNVPKSAMLFAAGLGTRMLPLTESTPKPMVKICGKPMIDYKLDKLAEIGVKRAVINTHHLPEQIEDHVKKRTDIEIIISREEELLETGGGIVKALPHLGNEPFYIINSDIIWLDKEDEDPALLRLAKTWGEKTDMLMLLHKVDRAIGYHGNGDFELDNNNQIKISKEAKRSFVYTGIQICNPELFKGLEVSKFSLSRLFKEAIGDDEYLKGTYGIEHNGEWLHIDSIDGIREAEEFLLKVPSSK